MLSLWTGTNHPLTEVACDDESGGNGTSVLFATLTGGTTYYVRVTDYDDTQQGRIALTVAAPPSDDLASAAVIPSPMAVPTFLAGTNVGATAEAGEADATCVAGGNDGANSVWWKFTADVNGTFLFGTFNSDFDTILSLWTGGSHPLAEFACDDESGGNSTSALIATLTAGTTYFVRVSGYTDVGYPGPEEGTIELVATPVEAGSDALADALIVTDPLPFGSIGSTVGTTVEPGEASASCAAGNDGANSVWWSYTPGVNGTVNFSTFSADFDTVLSLWTGTNHPLTEVACDDDSGGDGTSMLPVLLTAGTTYFVRVSGKGSSEGTVSVDFGATPANDEQADATLVAGALPQALNGTTVSASAEVDEPATSCEAVANPSSVWYRYMPTSDGTLDLSVPGVGDGLSIGVFDALGTELGSACNPTGVVAARDLNRPRAAREQRVAHGQRSAREKRSIGERRAVPAKRDLGNAAANRARQGALGSMGRLSTRLGGPLGVVPQGTRAALSVAVTGGQTYFVRVASPSGAEGPFALSADGPVSLPVELVAFTATADGRTARLSWTTASETNNAGFTVEQKIGDAWADRGFVAGRGTTTERSDYAFTVAGLDRRARHTSACARATPTARCT